MLLLLLHLLEELLKTLQTKNCWYIFSFISDLTAYQHELSSNWQCRIWQPGSEKHWYDACSAVCMDRRFLPATLQLSQRQHNVSKRNLLLHVLPAHTHWQRQLAGWARPTTAFICRFTGWNATPPSTGWATVSCVTITISHLPPSL